MFEKLQKNVIENGLAISSLKLKYKKLICTLAVTISLLITLQAQTPVDYTLQGSDITIEDGIITACSYDFSANTDGTNLTIPDGLGITGITDGEEDIMGYVSGGSPFAEKNLKSVQLPSTLEYIGDYAFRENDLKKISIPSGVTFIGRDAFYTNDIDSVFIPNSVITIGANAFHTNENMDTVVFEDESHLVRIASLAFAYTNITSIKLPTPIVPQDNFEYWIEFDYDWIYHEGGAIVPYYDRQFRAKFDYTLTDDDVEVVDGVIESCSYDFNGKFVIIPDELDGQTVTGIAGASSQKSGIFYGKGLIELTLPSSLKTIGQFSFNSNSIDTLLIPASVETIEKYAFWGFDLDTVIFEPDCHLSVIGFAAFDNNSNLKMSFPSPVKENYEFTNWADGNENTFEGGDQITEFEAAYAANFSLLPENPGIELSGDLSFGDVDEQVSSSSTLTIHNSGNAQLSVSNLTLPEGFSANWTSGEIDIENEQQVEITFLPTEAKSYTGYLKVISDATIGVDSILLEGTGTAAPVISLSEDIVFTNIIVDSEETAILTISNTGSADLNVSSIELSTGFTADWNSGTVASGNDQEVIITFSPTELKDYEGIVTVNSNADAGENTINISGTVIGAASISLSGNLDFGDVAVNTSANKTLTINNSGSATLEVTNIQLPGGFSAYPSNCNIEAGASKDIAITFTPVELKAYSGTITVVSNAGNENNTISVSGTGVKSSSLENTNPDIYLDIYPNPTNNIINMVGNEVYSIELISISGNIILRHQMDQLNESIDLSIYPNGIYLLKIINKEGKTNLQKVIKN
jgi:hypothetical protein